MGDVLHLFRIMGCGDHNTNGMAVVLHASKGSQDADTKHDRVKAITTIMSIIFSDMICFKEGRYYIQRPEASSSILILIISRFGVFIRNL